MGRRDEEHDDDAQTTLRGHKNWVKGVAWDPTGRFLASAGEDRRVLVWRRDKNASSEFRVEADIRAPFEDVTAQTFFQRLILGAGWEEFGRAERAESSTSDGLRPCQR